MLGRRGVCRGRPELAGYLRSWSAVVRYEAARGADPVAPAQRSDEALAKAARKRTDDDTPVHSFTSLLADLATICANHIQPTDDLPAFTKVTTPTPLQRRALELLGVSPHHGLA